MLWPSPYWVRRAHHTTGVRLPRILHCLRDWHEVPRNWNWSHQMMNLDPVMKEPRRRSWLPPKPLEDQREEGEADTLGVFSSSAKHSRFHSSELYHSIHLLPKIPKMLKCVLHQISSCSHYTQMAVDTWSAHTGALLPWTLMVASVNDTTVESIISIEPSRPTSSFQSGGAPERRDWSLPLSTLQIWWSRLRDNMLTHSMSLRSVLPHAIPECFAIKLIIKLVSLNHSSCVHIKHCLSC